jgi:geranylgeranyl pyrophosphate synthase
MGIRLLFCPHGHSMLDGYSTLISQMRGDIDSCLTSFLDSRSLSKRLGDAVEYALFPAGKRSRPLLALLIGHDMGMVITDIIPAAAAIELLHSASLVHDDLPALDDDSMRRGKPSLHVAFGEAVAVLTGDVMVSLAFELVSRAKLASKSHLRIMEIIARAYSELCCGQDRDLLNDERVRDTVSLYAQKTGALFGAAAELGAINSEHFEIAGEFGRQLGIAFQIHDDLIDGCEYDKGRGSSSDVKNQRVLMPLPSHFEKVKEVLDLLKMRSGFELSNSTKYIKELIG